MKRKIFYITGTRADYGLMKSVLKEIEKHPKLELDIVVTGMHLMPEFGMTVKEIKRDGFEIHEIDATYENDSKESMANFIGKFTQLLTKKVKDINPDIILLLGDRGEMVAGAIVGAYLTIPVAHLHGGEVTSTIDGLARHAITKLAHIHLPATELSAKRIILMGEESWRVHVIGAPGLDLILNEKLLSKEEICNNLSVVPKKPIFLVIQHPVTMEIEQTEKQMRETMEAITHLKQQTVVVYPNADAGGRRMIKVINEYVEYPFIKIFKSIPHKEYLSLMKIANVMVGNSSSGIIEAPSFRLPVVNIGTRQEGRERSDNVIDVNYSKKEIISAINKAMYDTMFIKKVKECENPYGDGKSGKRVANVLDKIKMDNRLLQKRQIFEHAQYLLDTEG